MLPAAGQGALGIEIRSQREDVKRILAPLADQTTWLAVAAERAVSRAMGGSCSMPLAAHAVLHGQVLDLHAAWGNPDDLNAPLIRAHCQGDVSSLADAEELGLVAAKQLRSQGAS
jgi:hydroxymethylbilane synthase